MHANEKLIEKFYTSFAQHDPSGMTACYATDIHFSDPVFDLKGKKAAAMWTMLCESGKDLVITFNIILADETSGRAHWEAKYTFSSTGRKVHNILEAEFQFTNGKIIRHQDHFNFWRWSHQAIGPAGTFLGWTPIIQKQVRKRAANNLEKFILKHPEFQS